MVFKNLLHRGLDNDLPGIVFGGLDRVVEDLSHAEFDQYAMNHDKNVRSCKLLRRPDLLFCFGFFAVLFEFDENNGHRDRTELSEIEHLEVIRRYVKETAKLKHALRAAAEGVCAENKSRRETAVV